MVLAKEPCDAARRKPGSGREAVFEERDERWLRHDLKLEIQLAKLFGIETQQSIG